MRNTRARSLLRRRRARRKSILAELMTLLISSLRFMVRASFVFVPILYHLGTAKAIVELLFFIASSCPGISLNKTSQLKRAALAVLLFVFNLAKLAAEAAEMTLHGLFGVVALLVFHAGEVDVVGVDEIENQLAAVHGGYLLRYFVLIL